jgi:hypothetical protein
MDLWKLARRRGGRAITLLATLAVLMTAVAVTPVAAAPGPSVVDYSQCANGQPPSTSLACPDGWINGILQASNSHYTEDQVTPQRAIINLPNGSGTSHTFTFKYQARKGSAQTHAYDSLATWNYTQTAADRCQGLSGTDCVGGAASPFPIPADPQVLAPFSSASGATSAHQLTGQQMELYGGTLTNISVPIHDCVAAGKCNDPSVDDYATVTVSFTVPSVPRKVQLMFGGHLAVGSQGGARTWGLGFGASNISGGPYHIKWDLFDGASVGNRDNQIMGSAIIFQNTGISTQVKKASDNTNVADGASVPLGTSLYDTATLTGNTATAGGTVQYFYKLQTGSTADCTSGTSLGTKTVTNGVVPQSDATGALSAGTYEFWAVYSGDANNNTSTSTCGSETVSIKASPGATTAQNLLPNDSATITGATSSAGGTLTFGLYPPSDATCAGSATYSQIVNVSGNGTYDTTNTLTKVSTEGTWRWKVVYSGDANNTGFTIACGEEFFTIENSSSTP